MADFFTSWPIVFCFHTKSMLIFDGYEEENDSEVQSRSSRTKFYDDRNSSTRSDKIKELKKEMKKFESYKTTLVVFHCESLFNHCTVGAKSGNCI